MTQSTINPINTEPRLFPLEHNWRTPFRESYDFKTDIITSGNGREQRRAVRFDPRRSVEMECRYKGEERNALDRFMITSQPEPCYFPLAHKIVRTIRPLGEEATSVLYGGGLRPWMKDGMRVVICDGWRKETRILSGATATTLTFSDKTKTIFPEGSFIYACEIGWVQQDAQSSHLSSNAGTTRLRFDLDPATDTPDVGNDGAYFIGLREYLNRRINWGDGIDVTNVFPREMVDYGYGRVQAFIPFDFASVVRKVSFLGKDYDQTKQIVDFFQRHKGRQREFLAQSFEPNIPYFAISPGSNTIQVEGTGFANDYAGSTVYRRILIRPKVGDDIHRQVESITALPDTNTSVITLTENLPNQNLAPSETYGIYWVCVSRFSTDRLDVDWRSDTVAQLAFTMQSLENFDV